MRRESLESLKLGFTFDSSLIGVAHYRVQDFLVGWGHFGTQKFFFSLLTTPRPAGHMIHCSPKAVSDQRLMTAQNHNYST